MLVLRLEFWSAVTGRKSTLGLAIVSNAGVSEDGARADYRVHVSRKGNAESVSAVLQAPLRKGTVQNHARLRENVWRLISKALAAAFPETRVRPFDAYEDAVHGVALRQPLGGLNPRIHQRIYLAGPMKGFAEHNHPAFARAAAALRASGHEVYSPAEFDPEHASKPYESFDARRAFVAFSDYITTKADAIVMLPGWEHSKGATTEAMLAGCCGLPLFELGEIP